MAKKFLDGSGTEHLIGKVKEKLSQAAYIEQDESQASIADFDPRTDTVWKKAQTLSSAEKAQVQQNIGISEWLNNLTGEKHESVVATEQTSSVTSLLPVTGEKDTIYRVGKWDGTQYNEEYYSDYAWDGTAYVQLNKKSIVGEVFDISEYHANAKYADLTAALGNDGENIPQSVRKGGMSVKFVQSSDNNYVQARCISNEFTTELTKWESVDSEPIDASTNLVESGGVYNVITKKINRGNIGLLANVAEMFAGIANQQNSLLPYIPGGYENYKGFIVDINSLTQNTITIQYTSPSAARKFYSRCFYYNENKTRIGAEDGWTEKLSGATIANITSILEDYPTTRYISVSLEYMQNADFSESDVILIDGNQNVDIFALNNTANLIKILSELNSDNIGVIEKQLVEWKDLSDDTYFSRQDLTPENNPIIPVDSTTIIRSVNSKILIHSFNFMYVDSGYKFAVLCYNLIGNFVGYWDKNGLVSSRVWLDDYCIIDAIPSTTIGLVSILVKKSDGSEITLSDVTNIHIGSIKYATKEELKSTKEELQQEIDQKGNNYGVDILHSKVLEYLNNTCYDGSDYSYNEILKYAQNNLDKPLPATISWEAQDCDSIEVKVAVYGDFSLAKTYTLDASATSFDVYNLCPTYGCGVKVTAIKNNVRTVILSKNLTAKNSIKNRFIKVGGLDNVRDLGGWQCGENKSIRYGKIFRGSAIDEPEHTITEDGKSTFVNELGLTYEFDLREGANVERQSAIGNSVMCWDVYGKSYVSGFEDTTNAAFIFQKIIDCINNDEVIYIHCSAGADRTAFYCAMIEGLLGVSENDITKDWELSSFENIAYTNNYRRYRNMGETYSNRDWAGLISAIKALSGNTWQAKFETYFTSTLGISNSDIVAFKNKMLV